MRQPNRVCKYSKCGKEYFACSDSIRLGGVKAHCCSNEHFSKWQIEVAYFRGQGVPQSPYLEGMVAEGALPESVLPKPKVRHKKESDLDVED